MRKAPLEVLCLIFELCVEDPPDDLADLYQYFLHRRARQHQPFYLAAVCRCWRTACLSCPRMWAHIILVLDFIASRDVDV